MTIDWKALLDVAVVTVFATVVVVSLIATAATLLNVGHARVEAGQTPGLRMVGGYALFGVVGLIVLFGLWLVIPYFH